MWEREEEEWPGSQRCDVRRTDWPLGLRDGEGPRAKEGRRAPGRGNGKKRYFPLEPPERPSPADTRILTHLLRPLVFWQPLLWAKHLEKLQEIRQGRPCSPGVMCLLEQQKGEQAVLTTGQRSGQTSLKKGQAGHVSTSRQASQCGAREGGARENRSQDTLELWPYSQLGLHRNV